MILTCCSIVFFNVTIYRLFLILASLFSYFHDNQFWDCSQMEQVGSSVLVMGLNHVMYPTSLHVS